MSFQPTLTTLLSIASGLLLIAVALFVYRAAPRERGNLAFALFSGAWGARGILVYTALSFTPGDPVGVALFLLTWPADALFFAGLVLMAAWFPRPFGPPDRPRFAGAVGLFAVLCGVGLWALSAPGILAQLGDFGGTPYAQVSVVVNIGFQYPAFFLVLLCLALRFRHAPAGHEARDRSQAAFLTAGIATSAGLLAGAVALGPPWPEGRVAGVVFLAAHVALAALWLRNAAAAEGPAARTARRLAWWCLFTALFGLLAVLPLAGTTAFAAGPQFGVARVVVVLVVAWGIVRHQLLGIDLKVRWTVKQSTVAAAFVGVFFVVSEGAQQFFATETNSQWLGIAAAGLLVFAMAPLQRAAERVASAAVPLADGAVPASRPEEAYRAAVRLALRDRMVTRREDEALAVLADELRIGHARALVLRAEVETDLAAEPVKRRARPARR